MARLDVEFDSTRTKVSLEVPAGSEVMLGRLLVRFPSATRSSYTRATVPLEEFIASIDALGNWPDPDKVFWDDQLKKVVAEALDDAVRARRLLAGEQADSPVDEDSVLELLGPGWVADLTEFQLRDVARLLSAGHGANFSVPGAGKTRVALALFSVRRAQGLVSKLLVVGPKSSYEAWTTESVTCFGRRDEVQIFDGQSPPQGDIVLLNYERLGRARAAVEEWMAVHRVMFVLDEAHRMKLGAAGVYGAACMALAPLSPARLILTGTPAPNSARDLENLLSFVWPGTGRSAVKEAVDGRDLVYASRALRPLYVRTTKLELGLPPIVTRVVSAEMLPLHREIYDAMSSELSARAESGRSRLEELGRSVLRLIMAATSPALLTEGSSRYEPVEFQVPALEIPAGSRLEDLFQRLHSYETPLKYQVTRKLVEKNVKAGRKTLVWANFVRSITSLALLLDEFQPSVVHGGTVDRDAEIRRFRHDPDCMVLVSNPATLGEGISLHQVCHDAIYVDRDFQAGRYLQSLDRIHRLGLAAEVETRVTVLASEATVDEAVGLRLSEKLSFMGSILDDPAVQQLGDPEDAEPVTAGMTVDDLEAVVKFARAVGDGP